MHMSTNKDAKDEGTTPVIAWNEHKAGLGNVDKAHVQEVITSLSRGSRFYAREEERASALSERVERIREQCERARKDKSLPRRAQQLDKQLLPALEAERVLGRVIACMDFDCFFAAVEALDDPSLVAVPHAVGGGKNGVLSTASYEARRFGVRSAMPTFIARRLCPQLRIVPTRYERYKEVSKLVEDKVLSQFDSEYRMGSLDEAFLDITHLVTETRTADEVVSELRQKVTHVTGGLTVSVGVGPNSLVAKICTDMNKPNGQTIVLPSDGRNGVVEFMSSLPLRKIPGIGKVLETVLREGVGLSSVGDIFTERAVLSTVLREKTFRFLMRSALGIGSTFYGVDNDEEEARKGISRERTFGPVRDEQRLVEILHNLCVMLEADLAKAGVTAARTVSLKLKTSGFKTLSRSYTLPASQYVSSAESIEKVAKRVLKSEFPIELRLLGVRLNKLTFKSDCNDSKRGVLRYLSQRSGDQGGVSPFNELGKSAVAVAQSTPMKRQRPDNCGGITGNAKLDVRNDGLKRCCDCRAVCASSDTSQPAHTNKYSCPVCNSRCFMHLGTLNSHLDACLASGARESSNASKNDCDNARVPWHKRPKR